MSGGTLTDDCCYPIFYIEEWAKRVEAENPMFAKLLREESVLLYAYDDYMSGDISKERIEKAWKEFSKRWFGNVDAIAEDVLKRVLESMRTGHREERQ